MQKLSDLITGSTKAKVLMNEPLSKHTTFKVGGPADLLIIPSDAGDIEKAVKIIRKERVPLFVMGNGSNLLISDDGIRGAVIKLAGSMNAITIRNNIVTAGAGTYLKKLIYTCAENGLAGLELFIGIPAALGGALAMNLGCWSDNISRVVKSVTVLTAEGKIKKLPRIDCGFSYRSSKLLKDGLIITEAELELKKDAPADISARQEQALKMKAVNQPVGYPSAGCVFKNPYPEIAGKLIEKAGLKGETMNGAQVSEVHGNFIINTGGATASDIVNLIYRIKGLVQQKFNIELETEIKMVGFEQ